MEELERLEARVPEQRRVLALVQVPVLGCLAFLEYPARRERPDFPVRAQALVPVQVLSRVSWVLRGYPVFRALQAHPDIRVSAREVVCQVGHGLIRTLLLKFNVFAFKKKEYLHSRVISFLQSTSQKAPSHLFVTEFRFPRDQRRLRLAKGN